jgi:aspartate/glutamate racemase
MNKPTVLLTGKQAGLWYVATLKKLFEEEKIENGFDVLQIDFEPINELLPHNMEEASKMLIPYFEEMEKREVPYIFANITLHEAIQYLPFQLKHFISIESILKKQKIMGSVAILGTKFTMNNRYIPSLLADNEMVVLPEIIQNKLEKLRKIYYQERDPEFAEEVFGAFLSLKIDYFLIACTELAIAFDDFEKSDSIINLAGLQCNWLFNSISRF